MQSIKFLSVRVYCIVFLFALFSKRSFVRTTK